MNGEEDLSPGRAQPGHWWRRRRRSALVIAMLVLLALVGAGVYTDLSSTNAGVVSPLVDRSDSPAPEFSLPELVQPSRTMSLTGFRGKPLVVNFWASWCDPCQTEMPLLEAAYRSQHGVVQFLGIDTDDTRKAALAFLARVHVTYPSLSLRQQGRVSTAYDLVGLPITVFISARGILVGRHLGQLNAATLAAALHLAFGARR
jgi:cytochrome c biogenesis protein CcmG/thiol:disulfide interchange protein DsbE